jgi:hypothetical protein
MASRPGFKTSLNRGTAQNDNGLRITGGRYSSSGGGTRTHNLPVNSRTRLPIELPRNELPAKLIGSNRRECSDTRLDLGMTRGAEEYALPRLFESGAHGACDAVAADAERLFRRIRVMELERSR